MEPQQYQELLKMLQQLLQEQTTAKELAKQELAVARQEATSYQREIALLQGQLKDKEEIITLLRGGYNRPN